LRRANTSAIVTMSDPNFHSSYDWAMGKWKRLRWNPTTSQWDFNDYYDGAPPTGERRDSQQPVGIAYSTTPTTGFSQAHIPYAGSSNYAQQQPHSYTSPTSTHAQSAYPQAAYAQPVGSRIEGRPVQGSYNPQNPATTLHYETLDSTYFVRNRGFFQEGRLFAVLFTEPAGANATRGNVVTDYNSSLSLVMLGGYAHTQVRRFIVVRDKKAFCYAVPIFSYQGQGTKKPGVSPQEHAIAYSYGTTPQPLPGEQPLSKAPICIVTNEGDRALSQASRIFFGIHHPIQYNVKVKDLGYVHPNEMPRFLGYWTMENGTHQPSEVAADTTPNGADAGDPYAGGE